ncbi:MAG: hypothetical protein AAFR76_03580 [Planctomycetota bacterium]
MERCLRLRKAMLLLVVVGGLCLLATGLLGLYYRETVYTRAAAPIEVMAEVRTWIVRELTVNRPELGRALWYEPGPVDWHLSGLGLVMLLWRRHTAALLTWCITPLVKTGFAVKISRETIAVRRGLRRCVFDRSEGAVALRPLPLEAYFLGRFGEKLKKWPGVDKHTPAAILEINQHYKRERLLSCRRIDQAEAIAGACFNASRRLNPSKPKL